MKKLIQISLVIVFIISLVFVAFPAQTGNTVAGPNPCQRVGWNSGAVSGCGVAGIIPGSPTMNFMQVKPSVGWNS